MKRANRVMWARRLSRWVVAATCGAVAVGMAAVDEAPTSPTVDGCRRNLQLIHDALGLYERMHGRWPRRLSDLAGLYVAPEVLICPECEQQRVFRMKDLGLLNIAEKDPQTVYKWELNVDQKAPGLEEVTFLEWKQKQRLTAVGDAVPIVRCDQHVIEGQDVHLNLSFGGQVYVSGPYWEELFREVLALPYLSTPGQVCVVQNCISERVPARPNGATPLHLDLGPVATALPGDPWQDGTSTDTMAGLVATVGPDGLWTHGGIGFDVRALVQLDGRRLLKHEAEAEEKIPGRNEWFYPTRPIVIPVRHAGRRLHVLGGAIFIAPLGAEIGGVVVNYAGGAVQRIPWRYGMDVRDGWHDTDAGSEEAHLAWTADGYSPNERGVPERRGPLKVYHWTTELDRPGESIESLEFFSSASNPDAAKQYLSGPFLLAATLE